MTFSTFFHNFLYHVKIIGGIMQAAKFSEIRNQLQLNDDKIYFYAIDKDGTILLRKATDYELLAEEGLKDTYLMEPDGLWEKCLED